MLLRIRSRGAALIIVLGMLMILALLATTFATLQATERNVARNYLDTVRARLLAESGIDAAVSHLQQLVSASPIPDPSTPLGRSWVYFGGEMNEASSPEPATLLSQARNPSFAWEDEAQQDPSDPNTRPRQVRIDGTPVGLSGITGGTYSMNGDQYTLRVRDLSGLIYVNNGMDQGNAGSVSQNLKRILNRLGDAIGAPGVGDAIVDRRPAFGYRSPQSLEEVLGTALYRQVAPFVTTAAWVDPNVANPVPFSASTVSAYPVHYHRGDPPVYRRGRGVDFRGKQILQEAMLYDGQGPPDQTNAIYALDELFPQWIEIVSRAPVHINAAPREVLIALLSDLQGVFVSHRKRSNPSAMVGGYHFATIIHTYSPEGSQQHQKPKVPTEGDEYGFLYKTAPIQPAVAATVAGAILDCREKRGPYASLPFGGPFRTWRQFNAFCDHLVSSGLIGDGRAVFYDHQLYSFTPGAPNEGIPVGNITGYGPLVPSAEEQRMGSQAMADVLKANFNPNLHLNETNPDANLCLLVDKTDLVVNSTEFILSPTGYFEIGSIGRVLRAEGGADSLAADNNTLVATHTMVAAVKLFDLYRETAQAQFAKGTLNGSSAPRPGTSNGKALEIGPEPDNGRSPLENEWGGYLALPTVGGLKEGKSPGELKPTPQEGADWGETIGVRFQRDFKPYQHLDGRYEELASERIAGESVENFPDPGEPAIACGPYAPTQGEPGRYRLARSFRLPVMGGTVGFPTLTSFAPLDLRIDGGYSERHSAPAYWTSPSSFIRSARDMDFVVSFWVKPSYPPARSGKPRLMFNAIRHGGLNFTMGLNQGQQNWLFMGYNPGHESAGSGFTSSAEDRPLFAEFQYNDPMKPFFGHAPLRPYSFLFGRGYGSRTLLPARAEANFYPRIAVYNAAAVNHEGHADGKSTLFKENRWTHVTLIAKPCLMEPTGGTKRWHPMIQPPLQLNQILVNGRTLPDTVEGYQRGSRLEGDATIDWTRHHNGEVNAIRLGTPSSKLSGNQWQRSNFSCDATIDEFHLWNSSLTGETAARRQWLLGRYETPAGWEGVFTSQPLRFERGQRTFAPASSIAPPEGQGGAIDPVAMKAPETEILGIQWTVYGQDANDPEVYVIHAGTGERRSVRVSASLKSGAGLYGPYSDDGFSPVAAPIRLWAADAIQYLIQVEVMGAGRPILLTTPVVDDVTIFYRSCEGPPFVYFVSVLSTGYAL